MLKFVFYNFSSGVWAGNLPEKNGYILSTVVGVVLGDRGNCASHLCVTAGTSRCILWAHLQNGTKTLENMFPHRIWSPLSAHDGSSGEKGMEVPSSARPLEIKLIGRLCNQIKILWSLFETRVPRCWNGRCFGELWLRNRCSWTLILNFNIESGSPFSRRLRSQYY